MIKKIMLTNLSISNYGLIDSLDIDFHDKLNVLTGETGAGKSIVLGALRICLGQKISPAQFRNADEPCQINAQFDLSKSERKYSESIQDFTDPDDATLIISRVHTPEGRNKIKINGQSVTVSQLKEIGGLLIDFHGPHDHQHLLSEETHIQMLDRLTDFKNLFDSYAPLYENLKKAESQLSHLQGLASSRERELDLLSHQTQELGQVSFDQQTFEDLKAEQIKINNAQRLNEYVQELLQILEGGDQNVSDHIRKTFTPMRKLNEIDENTSSFAATLDQLQALQDQLSEDINDYARSLAFDPSHAEDVENKCDLYDMILRKYGPTLEDAEKFYTEAKEKYDSLINFENDDQALRKQIEELKTQLSDVAEKISKQRQSTAKALKQTIEKELSELGMKHIQFDVKITQSELSENGFDSVVFYISPNAGEDLKPLADIVSSGEAARVMLALKKALVKVDPVPVLIFDEIDAQIGGRLGTITGEKLKSIAGERQVLLITHLPQIASFADKHFKITKSVIDGRALTQLSPLSDKQRIEELAEMMSGDQDSTTAKKHAKEMLATAR